MGNLAGRLLGGLAAEAARKLSPSKTDPPAEIRRMPEEQGERNNDPECFTFSVAGTVAEQSISRAGLGHSLDAWMHAK